MVRKRSRYRTPLIIGAIIVALIFSSYAISGNTWRISGSGGIVPKVTAIDYTHPDPAIDTIGTIDDWSSTYSIDPIGYYSAFLVTSDPVGVSMTLGNINYGLTTEYLLPVLKTTDNGDGTYTHILTEVSVAKCQMTVEFRTYGTGLDPIKNVVFTVQLEENQFNIFDSADAVEAYFLDVKTLDAVDSSAGNIQLKPSAGGIPIPYLPVNTEPTPQWIVDAGYAEYASELKTVDFKLEVVSAVPNWEYGWPYPKVSHVSSDITIAIEMLVFGHWTRVSSNADFEGTPDDETMFDTFMRNLESLVDVLGPVVVMVTIVAVAIVVVVLVIQFGKFIPKRG